MKTKKNNKVSFKVNNKNENKIKFEEIKKYLESEIDKSYEEYNKSLFESIKYFNTDKYLDYVCQNTKLYKEYKRKERALEIINNKKNNSIEEYYYLYYRDNVYSKIVNK